MKTVEFICLALLILVCNRSQYCFSQVTSSEEITIPEINLAVVFPAGGRITGTMRAFVNPEMNGHAALVRSGIDYGQIHFGAVHFHTPEAWAAFDSTAVVERLGPDAFEGSGDYVDLYLPESYDKLRRALSDSSSVTLSEVGIGYEYVQAGHRGYLLHCNAYEGSHFAPAITFVDEYMVVIDAFPQAACGDVRARHLELLSQLRFREVRQGAEQELNH